MGNFTLVWSPFHAHELRGYQFFGPFVCYVLNLVFVSLSHCSGLQSIYGLRSVSRRAGANLLQFGPPNLDLPLAMGLRCLQMDLDL